jgi:hypothetical protein
MPPADLTALQRSVIVCGPNQLCRHTVEEATESAERLGQRAAVDYFGARVQEQQQIQAARDTQMELDAHFVLVSRIHLLHLCLPIFLELRDCTIHASVLDTLCLTNRPKLARVHVCRCDAYGVVRACRVLAAPGVASLSCCPLRPASLT